MITLHDLSIGYTLKNKQKKVLKEHITVSLQSGELTCLMGRNGSGKSTLIRTIAGFIPPLSGKILYQNQSFGAISEGEKALILGVVLTDKTNAGGLTVYELVSLGRQPHTGFFGLLTDYDKQCIEVAMNKVGITHKASSFISQLSDGERQKAMIAKTLAQECPLILLDEPTAFLDLNSRIETMELLLQLAQEENKAILLSTHDVESAARMGTCLWLMDKEKDFISGTPSDLIGSGVFDSYFHLDQFSLWSAKNYLPA